MVLSLGYSRVVSEIHNYTIFPPRFRNLLSIGMYKIQPLFRPGSLPLPTPSIFFLWVLPQRRGTVCTKKMLLVLDASLLSSSSSPSPPTAYKSTRSPRSWVLSGLCLLISSYSSQFCLIEFFFFPVSLTLVGLVFEGLELRSVEQSPEVGTTEAVGQGCHLFESFSGLSRKVDFGRQSHQDVKPVSLSKKLFVSVKRASYSGSLYLPFCHWYSVHPMLP